MLIAARTGLAVCAIVTRFVDHVVAVIVFLVATNLRVHPWCIAETPLIASTNFTANAAFRHTVTRCTVAATLTLLVDLHVTVIVAAITTNFCHRLGAGTPDAATTDLRPTATVITGSLFTVGTLIDKTLAIDAAPVWTITVDAATVLDHLADTIDKALTGWANAAIRKHHDTSTIYAAFVTVTVARESTRRCLFGVSSSAAGGDTDDEERENNVDYFFHIPFSCPKKCLQRK